MTSVQERTEHTTDRPGVRPVGPVAPPTSAARAPQRTRPIEGRHERSPSLWLAATLTGVGILALSFVGFQLWGSDVVQARSQRELRSQLDGWLVQAQGFADGAGGGAFGSQFGGQPTDLLAETLTVPEVDRELGDDAVAQLESQGFEVLVATEPSEDVLPGVVIRTDPAGGSDVEEGARITVVVSRLGRGAPVALLRIPEIGLEQVVVEGTSPELAMEGPGHLRGTPLPGEPGTSVVLGHRSTYGAPFSRLGQLVDGDEVQVLTTSGAHTYRVAGDPRILRAGEPDVVEIDDGDRLVLATAHPELSATDRLVVEAVLEGEPVEPRPVITGADTEAVPVVELSPPELGRTGEGAAWAKVLLLSQLLLVALLVTRWLYRHWLRWPTWLLTTPVLAALGFALFGAVNLLLPSTL